MREVESIEFALENCEGVKIDRENIGTFYLDDIKRSISRSAMNSIGGNYTAENLVVQICSKANRLDAYTSTWSGNDRMPFERLTTHNDICGVQINYQDGSSEYLYVKWIGDSEYNNDAQSSKINPHTNDLYIVVGKDLNLEEVFGDELEEDDAFCWEMYEGM